MLAEARRREITERLRANGAVTVAEVEERFGVSPMTARRDLAELERRGVVRRTHGGAVLPTISAHEDSFARRLEVDADDKARLAEAAVDCSRRGRPSSWTPRPPPTTWRAGWSKPGCGHRADQLPAGLELLFKEGGPGSR